MMDIKAFSYSGQYGTTEDNGDIINVIIDVENNMELTMNKEIIFLIDISGSMHSSLLAIKSSLLAFRDALLNITPDSNLSDNHKDIMLRNKIKLRLITFSKDANEIWSNRSKNTFEDSVLNLDVESMTNMGAALNLAFDKINPEIFTWVIVMTDGESNIGPCKTVKSFHKLITEKKPINTKIISLGYGSSFDPDVLNKIGTFVYVKESKVIPVVLGNVADEIMKAVAFNCVINIPTINYCEELNEDTIIIPDGTEKIIMGKTIIGKRLLGTLCSGDNYNYVYLPHGNINTKYILSKYSSVKIEYTEILTGEIIKMEIPIDHTGYPPPESMSELYFEEEKKRLIYRLYRVIYDKQFKNVGIEIGNIRRAIEKWTDPMIEHHKEEISAMLERCSSPTDLDNTNTMLNYAVRSGYDTGRNRYVDSALSSTEHYLATPMINISP